ncbi:MAG: M20/M25/M40 family metallo-hydrolase [Gemmatimonadales bacterium]|nr:M20/M25/M40 family metallo-hydrolase [Gemmatimonadales bacterium]
MTPCIGILALLALGAPSVTLAQNPAVARAAGTITEADVRRRIGIISDDSMMGRNTPSPGLTKTANYVASEFKRLRLKPGGENGSYLQNYPIYRKKLLADRSVVRFGSASGDQGARVTLADGAAWGTFRLAVGPWKGGIVLVGGQGRTDSLPSSELRGKMVVYVTDWTKPGAGTRLQALTRVARDAGAIGVISLINSDSVFNERYGNAAARVYEVAGAGTVGLANIGLREGAITRQIPEAAERFGALRQAPSAVVVPYPDWEGEVVLADTVLSTAQGPNMVGILEGSDPTLKNEYVVFSAHMDHVGKTGELGAACRAMGADSICNGADDDASGTAGVLELAEAFSSGVRPKRSIIFLTVSGEEHGLWGSRWFVNNSPVPIKQVVANFNTDMIGRNWKDTIVAIGKEHSDLGSTLNRVNAAHPELRMNAIDDRWPEEDFYRRSDHFNFAQKGVPVLFFFNGVHADYHRPGDTVDKIDAEKESRIVKLVFYTGLEVANAAKRPQWVPSSFQQIVTP